MAITKNVNPKEKFILAGIKDKQKSKKIEEFFTKLKGQTIQSRIFSGTSIPNSTFKSIHSINANKPSTSSRITSVKTLESFEVTTRRSTIEKIRNAIEKQKEQARLDLVEHSSDPIDIEFADASTSTVKKKRKKKKKKELSKNSLLDSNRSSSMVSKKQTKQRNEKVTI
ncbi:hypothetical protein ABEB36_006640 [Hypothenemus hampei]|uniref:Uncharacterized protein n=1 Tax=Hypothenemus hampei TaxID=57062 RepID=A0ABD1ERR0_HYPHA